MTVQLVVALILAAVAFAVPAAAQKVPDDIHSVVQGPSELCGITARNARHFEAKVRAIRTYRQQPDRSRLHVFLSTDQQTQWSFATRANPAYPLATCRKIRKRADGSSYVHREMRCDAPRAACDKVFLEFHKYDEQLRRVLRTGGRG